MEAGDPARRWLVVVVLVLVVVVMWGAGNWKN
jgi:hypothetical protein